MTNYEGALPLSSPQQQIWLHQALVPTIPLYNIGGSVRIDGPLSVERLEAALRAVVSGTDTLRTVLIPGDPIPTQRFATEMPFNVELHDFSGHDDPEGAARAWMLELFTRPFELSSGNPLFDFSLVHVTPTRHYWLHKYHHLITDGWAISLVVHRVAEQYEALDRGQPLDLVDAGSYERLIAAETSYLSSARFEDDREYWAQKLSRRPVPLTGPRARIEESHSLGWTIDRERYDALSAWCRGHDASMFHLVLGAVCTYFARTGRRTDLLLGLPALNRRSAREKATIGLCAGLKPGRFTVAHPAQTATDLLLHLRTELSHDYRHYRFPLAAMGRHAAGRDGAFGGLFDLVLSFEVHDYDAQIAGRTVHMRALPNGFEQNGLAIFVRDYHHGRDVQVDFNYNAGAFSDIEVTGLIDGLDCLLNEMHEHPERPLRRLSLMPPAASAQLAIWSTGDLKPLPPGLVIDWFAAFASGHPDTTAVVCGTERLTYRELDQRANALAWRLRALGVGPESSVGIRLGRHPDLLVAVLGVLKAGGAYVPIDPGYPVERVHSMVSDAGIGLVVGGREALHELSRHGVRFIDVGQDRTDHAPESSVQQDNLAYMIFTSGSTGRPKGVMVSHRAIGNYLRFAIAAYRLAADHDAVGGTPCEQKMVPLHSSLGFDATITSLLAPLVAGCCVDMLPGSNALASLCEAIHDREYALVKVTPSHLSVLQDELSRDNGWSRPRVLVLGGEALDDALLAFWRTRAPDTLIVNEYGPTEAAVGCSVHDAGDGPAVAGTPIGKPIWNTRLMVVDQDLETVPAGSTGELCIAGIGLARGYAGRPDLTAARFVPDPFSTEPGTRMYRTGDLVRYRPDGTLDYIGRRDAQVKLRGHRVELGEVEGVLRRHPQVRDAVVVLADDHRGHSQLIAYVVGNADGPPTTEDLKQHARRWLPDVMIPAGWRTLPAIPLTANGKVDRAQLATAPDAGGWHTALEPAVRPQPSSVMERDLAAIFADVLGVEEISCNDNFFDLHGDSIDGLRIVSRARTAGIEIKLAEIFNHQTIAALGTVARRITTPTGDDGRQGEPTGDTPLTPMQHWLIEQDLPDLNQYTHILELDVDPGVDPALLEQCLDTLVGHHHVLRGRLRQGAGPPTFHIVEHDHSRWLQVVNRAPGTLDVTPTVAEVADLTGRLDLRRGPLLSGLLCRSRSLRQARLMLAAHHAVVDVISWQVLLDDLRVLYRQHVTGHPVVLAPSIHYRRWALRLVEHAAALDPATEIEYWLRANGIDPTVLPANQLDAGAHTAGSAGLVEWALDGTTSPAELTAAATAYQCAIDELLLTAVAMAVHSVTGRRDVVLDIERHGRNPFFDDVDLSRTVGWMTSLHPVHLQLPDGAPTGQAAAAAITRQLRSIPHGGQNYALLRYLSPDTTTRARLAAQAEPQLLFNYVGAVDRGAAHDPWFRGNMSLRLWRSPAAPRRYALEVDVVVIKGELLLRIAHGHQHSRDAVRRLAKGFAQQLERLVDAAPTATFSATDFPGARMDQAELDAFLGRFR